MEPWTFLIQKEGDTVWLPLESTESEILEGRYRIMARTDQSDCPLSIQVSHLEPDVFPPRRRVHKRQAHTNSRGLVAILPFTLLQSGVWDIRCQRDSDAAVASSRQEVPTQTLQLQVLAQDSEADIDDLPSFYEEDTTPTTTSQNSEGQEDVSIFASSEPQEENDAPLPSISAIEPDHEQQDTSGEESSEAEPLPAGDDEATASGETDQDETDQLDEIFSPSGANEVEGSAANDSDNPETRSDSSDHLDEIFNYSETDETQNTPTTASSTTEATLDDTDYLAGIFEHSESDEVEDVSVHSGNDDVEANLEGLDALLSSADASDDTNTSDDTDVSLDGFDDLLNSSGTSDDTSDDTDVSVDGLDDLLNSSDDSDVSLDGLDDLFNSSDDSDSPDVSVDGLDDLLNSSDDSDSPDVSVDGLDDLLNSSDDSDSPDVSVDGLDDLFNSADDSDSPDVSVDGLDDLLNSADDSDSPDVSVDGLDDLLNSADDSGSSDDSDDTDVSLDGLDDLLDNSDTSDDTDVSLDGLDDLLSNPDDSDDTDVSVDGLDDLLNSADNSDSVSPEEQETTTTESLENVLGHLEGSENESVTPADGAPTHEDSLDDMLASLDMDDEEGTSTTHEVDNLENVLDGLDDLNIDSDDASSSSDSESLESMLDDLALLEPSEGSDPVDVDGNPETTPETATDDSETLSANDLDLEALEDALSNLDIDEDGETSTAAPLAPLEEKIDGPAEIESVSFEDAFRIGDEDAETAASDTTNSETTAFEAIVSEPSEMTDSETFDSETFGTMDSETFDSETFGTSDTEAIASETFETADTETFDSETFGTMDSETFDSETFGTSNPETIASETFETADTETIVSETFEMADTEAFGPETFETADTKAIASEGTTSTEQEESPIDPEMQDILNTADEMAAHMIETMKAGFQRAQQDSTPLDSTPPTESTSEPLLDSLMPESNDAAVVGDDAEAALEDINQLIVEDEAAILSEDIEGENILVGTEAEATQETSAEAMFENTGLEDFPIQGEPEGDEPDPLQTDPFQAEGTEYFQAPQMDARSQIDRATLGELGLNITLAQDSYVVSDEHPLVLEGQVESDLPLPATVESIGTLALRIQLVQPQTGQQLLIQDVALRVESLPSPFSVSIPLPATLNTHLVVGDMALCVASSPEFRPDAERQLATLPDEILVLSQQSFTVTVDLQTLLNEVERQPDSAFSSSPQVQEQWPELPPDPREDRQLADGPSLPVITGTHQELQPAGQNPLPPELLQTNNYPPEVEEDESSASSERSLELPGFLQPDGDRPPSPMAIAISQAMQQTQAPNDEPQDESQADEAELTDIAAEGDRPDESDDIDEGYGIDQPYEADEQYEATTDQYGIAEPDNITDSSSFAAADFLLEDDREDDASRYDDDSSEASSSEAVSNGRLYAYEESDSEESDYEKIDSEESEPDEPSLDQDDDWDSLSQYLTNRIKHPLNRSRDKASTPPRRVRATDTPSREVREADNAADESQVLIFRSETGEVVTEDRGSYDSSSHEGLDSGDSVDSDAGMANALLENTLTPPPRSENTPSENTPSENAPSENAPSGDQETTDNPFGEFAWGDVTMESLSPNFPQDSSVSSPDSGVTPAPLDGALDAPEQGDRIDSEDITVLEDVFVDHAASDDGSSSDDSTVENWSEGNSTEEDWSAAERNRIREEDWLEEEDDLITADLESNDSPEEGGAIRELEEQSLASVFGTDRAELDGSETDGTEAEGSEPDTFSALFDTEQPVTDGAESLETDGTGFSLDELFASEESNADGTGVTESDVGGFDGEVVDGALEVTPLLNERSESLNERSEFNLPETDCIESDGSASNTVEFSESEFNPSEQYQDELARDSLNPNEIEQDELAPTELSDAQLDMSERNNTDTDEAGIDESILAAFDTDESILAEFDTGESDLSEPKLSEADFDTSEMESLETDTSGMDAFELAGFDSDEFGLDQLDASGFDADALETDETDLGQGQFDAANIDPFAPTEMDAAEADAAGANVGEYIETERDRAGEDDTERDQVESERFQADAFSEEGSEFDASMSDATAVTTPGETDDGAASPPVAADDSQAIGASLDISALDLDDLDLSGLDLPELEPTSAEFESSAPNNEPSLPDLFATPATDSSDIAPQQDSSRLFDQLSQMVTDPALSDALAQMSLANRTELGSNVNRPMLEGLSGGSNTQGQGLLGRTSESEILPPLPSDMPIPVPVLHLPDEELIAGTPIPVSVTLPRDIVAAADETSSGSTLSLIFVKLWVQDRQMRSILDGPRWLVDFVPNRDGDLEAMTQLVLPIGCLDVSVEAIAVEMATQRESLKTSIQRTIMPAPMPDELSDFNFDDLN